MGSRVTGELRDLADTVERLSQHFGWSAPDIDRDLTGAPGPTANSHDTLSNLAASLDAIHPRMARLAAEARDICAGLPGQHPVASAAPTQSYGTVTRGSSSIEL